MRLDKDCIREILLLIENKCVYYEHPKLGKRLFTLSFKQIYEFEEMKEYNADDIHYTISKLFEGHYIEGYVIPPNNFLNFSMCVINALTLRGHDLLDNIRPETVWQETKSVLKRVGDFSLTMMTQVAGEVMAAYTKSMMKLQ